MHVAIDARLAHYTAGGITHYTLNLARALAASAPSDRFTLLRSVKQRGGLPVARNLGSTPLLTPPHHRFEQLSLPLEVARVCPDLLHCPDFIPPLHRTFRSVISVHDLAFRFFPEFVTAESRRYYGQVEAAMASADAILVDAASTRDDLERELGIDPKRVTVVYLAADEIFRPLPTAQVEEWCAAHHLPVGGILWVGTLEPRKNVATLLRAYARLQDAPTLVLAAKPGWLMDDTAALIDSLGIKNRVVWFQQRGQDDLLHLYNAAKLFVFPSLYEGFGFPPLEAMACGTPVVSSEAGSLAEVIGDAALAVPPKDEAAIAEAMDRALRDVSLATELRIRGLERAARFSWDRTAEETLAVYRRVMAA